MFTIYRTNGLSSSVTVKFDIRGDAWYGDDYSLNPTPSGSPYSITLPANVASKTFTVTVNPSTTWQGPISAVIVLLEGSNYHFSGPSEAQVNLYLDSPAANTIELSLINDVATESGLGIGAIDFQRYGSVSNAVVVNYSVTGSALNGVDFDTLSGSVTIPAGKTNTVVYIKAIDDAVAEDDETVIITVLPDSNYTVGTSSSKTVIIKEDFPTSPLVAKAATFNRAKGTALRIPIQSILSTFVRNDNSLNLELAAIGSSTNGASISADGTYINFSPTNYNVSESFSYIIRASNNVEWRSTNWITVSVTNAASLQILGPYTGGGGITLKCAGIAGYTYILERTGNLTEPVNWSTIGVKQTAPANGLLSFPDTSPINPAYYRIRQDD